LERCAKLIYQGEGPSGSSALPVTPGMIAALWRDRPASYFVLEEAVLCVREDGTQVGMSNLLRGPDLQWYLKARGRDVMVAWIVALHVLAFGVRPVINPRSETE
jgi:hypothetical protein